MSFLRPARLFVPLLVGVAALLATACMSPNTQYTAAEKDTKPAVNKEALEGSAFNKFFPTSKEKLGDYDFVFDQEKKGLALGSLKKGSMTVATLSISDTVSEPDARDKFKDSTEKIGEFPVGAESKLETCVLVSDRFQVKVRSSSKDSVIQEEQRKEWLKKFDLAGLAKLR